MRRHVILTIALFASLLVFGQAEKIVPQRGARVPAYPGVIERIQPDGDTLHIYLRGDEGQHYTITLDGWQVAEDERGVLCYAVEQKDGTVAAGKRQAHDEGQRKCCEKRWLRRKGIKKEVILY